MKRQLVAAMLVAIASLSGRALTLAAASPIASVEINGVIHSLSLTADPTKPDRFFFDEVIEGTDFEVLLRGTLDPDPAVLFGLTASNFGISPLSVALTLGLPIVLPPGPSIVKSGVTGTLTPGALDPLGLTLTPLLGDTDGDGIPEIVTTTDGVVNLGADVGPAAAIAGALPLAYGPFGATAAGPPGLAFLGVNVAFSLTGGGDTVDLTGAAQAVPEPVAMVLTGLGLLAGAGRTRARARRSKSTLG